MILRVLPLRFHFQAINTVRFPRGKAANVFRGGLGLCLRDTSEAAYNRLFAPRAQAGPSGFEDQPRPFVLRASPLDGLQFEPGQRFSIEMNTFDPAFPVLEAMQKAFGRLANQGLGPGRARATLLRTEALPELSRNLIPASAAIAKISIAFLTPTELKTGGAILRQPDFGVLLARARDRVSSICSFYQTPLSGIDYAGLGTRAAAIRMTSSAIQQVEVERRSSRTGQTHSLGGFTGWADYEGDLAEFLPWLEAAQSTGVGRLTVWGNGAISLTIH